MDHPSFRGFLSLGFVVWMGQRFRAFVSLGLILCMLLSFVPLGCHSVRVQHGFGRAGQPHIPEATAERLEECAALVEEDTRQERHSVKATITVDEGGRVLDATTTGEPNTEVGRCIRVNLREMHVGKEVINDAALRANSSESSSAELVPPNRAFVGQVETVVVVTVVYVEIVIIEEMLVPLAIAVTAKVVASAATNSAPANAAQRSGTPRGTRKPHQPNVKKWVDNGGSIDVKADGTTTYTRSDGVSVTYNKDGFPDFTPYRHPTVKDVQIEFTGDYDKDKKLADKAAGITKKMRDDEGYVWHHHEDGKTMQLIKESIHTDFFHTGGMSGARK